MPEKNYEKMTATELEKAAEANDAEAMYRLWLMFGDGDAEEPYFKALSWLQEAAAMNHLGAVAAYNEYRAESGDDY